MKRLKKLKSVAFAILVGASAWSCVDNNDFELPVIERPEPVAIEAATADVSVYKVGEYVKMHGNIVVDGKWSYFELGDGTRIQIYASSNSVFESLSDDQKKKLATPGQEVTVTGTFKDYKLKDGKVIKEIVYNKAEDVVFGDNVVTPKVVKLEAEKATAKDYEDNKGKEVELHGKLVIKDKRAHFSFADGTLIQIYVKDFKEMSKEDKDKLNTAGQEVTIVGTFDEYKGTKQIQCKSEGITFGKAPEQGGGETTGEVLKASDLTESDFKVNEQVKVMGKIVFKDNKSYFEFKDKTMVRIFAYSTDWANISNDVKKKLNTNGQEVTVTGVYKEINGEKGIAFKQDSDLEFGKAPEGGGETTPPNTDGVIQAATATVADYVVGEKVKVHGKIHRAEGKSYFKFKDNTMVRIFAWDADFKKLSEEAKTKFSTEGQEITVSGSFKDFGGEKGIIFKEESDLEFGNTPSNGGGTTDEKAGEFKFEDLKIGGYNEKGSLTEANALLDYKARTSLDDKYKIDGGGLMIRNQEEGYITITFKKGIKTLSFDYRRAYSGVEENRVIEIYKGDKKIETIDFKNPYTEILNKKVKINESGEVTITFKVTTEGPVVFDNISWTE
ncbi:hypothetical protein KRX57_10465 [Weeksellaceae bacterium TAE3-ERU29]|nr:hypothetical protein [Weeksellaceae bacterium TAE3-ERU29]